ncbi:MAG: hypothetical protein Q9162_004124 [Coniocarpon cinnabarinum]
MALLVLSLGTLASIVQGQCWEGTACTGPQQAAFDGPWNDNIFADSTRSSTPVSVLTWPDLSSQPVENVETLTSNGSLLTYDFGKEVGGIISLDWNSTTTGSLGIAFSEAKNYVGYNSDSSNGAFKGPDGYLSAPLTPSSGTYTMPSAQLRGGFRYMTVFLLTNDTSASPSVSISNVTALNDFQPTWSNLKAYQGYFHSSSDLLNRIWYAGAYTLQSNIVPPDTGRQVPFLTTGWANNASMGPGDQTIVDGAKRDRAVWPGDMGVAVPSTFVSLGDLDAVRNALQVMYDTQNKTTGAFAESGPPLSQTGSDTYHMWSMIGTYNYVLYTNDTAWLEQNWAGYKAAMDFILGKVLPDLGLLNVTGTRDWARRGQGGTNTEANMILYRTLITGASLAEWFPTPNATLSASWTSQASSLATAAQSQLYDTAAGAFQDNTTALGATLNPQDANGLSLLFFPQSSNQSTSIATVLQRNWTPIGPVAPELPDNISPFISSFELQGRLHINDTANAMTLLNDTWGFIINNPNSTESTLLEGYLANGSFGYRNYQGYSYDSSYVSHAHGWSSGPTSALTNYILGLDVTAPAGKEWSLAPRVEGSGLSFVEGGFVTSLGKFQAGWNATDDGGVEVWWSVPETTNGVVTVPMGCVNATVRLSSDGEEAKEVRDGDKGVNTGLTVGRSAWMSVSMGGGAGHVTVAC